MLKDVHVIIPSTIELACYHVANSARKEMYKEKSKWLSS